MVGLFKYISVKQCQNEDTDDKRKPNYFPDPNGELCSVVVASSI